jgi:hypothetical protein
VRVFLLLAALPLWAADDANAILRRYMEADKLNDKRAERYTFVEDRVWSGRDKNGEVKQHRSETAEMIFVEGQTYRKLVARNGKPLDAKEKAKVDKEMRETAEQRRKRRPEVPGGRVVVNHTGVDLGSDEELLTLFDNRLVGEEEIAGRKAWVIESTPREGRHPANRHERDVTSFGKKLWIDQTENVELRELDTVTGEHTALKPGSTIQWDCEKINQDAWQTVLITIIAKWPQTEARLEIRYSNFKKFDVQSTITLDPPKSQ